MSRSKLPDALSEKNLLRKLRKNQADALEEFIHLYTPHIYNLHYWFCGNNAVAEDLTQETLLAVWRDIKNFRGASRLGTWVHRVARNIALQYLSRRKEGNCSLEEISELPAPTDTAALAQRALLKEKVRQALRHLPASQREVILLHCLEGFSHRETAKMLARPLGTVKWQIAQGLGALRQALLELGVSQDEL